MIDGAMPFVSVDGAMPFVRTPPAAEEWEPEVDDYADLIDTIVSGEEQ